MQLANDFLGGIAALEVGGAYVPTFPPTLLIL